MRNAHSVYVETLAETGLVGGLLLAGALAPALVAAAIARRRRLVPAATGAYVLFLVHAAIDWDWELPAVTLAAFASAAAVLIAARDEEARLLSAPGRRIALAAAGVLAVVSLAGFFASRALEDAGEMVAARRWVAADAAGHRALTWAPWSAEAWLRIGQAQVARERYPAGERSIRRAIARDPQNWSLWFDLALATVGREQLRALARAEQLNPLSVELAQFREGVIAQRA